MTSPQSSQQSPKKRNACDRCHALKSRCTRQPGMESCNRCVRLAMICVYSPPLRLGRPKGSKRGVSANRSRKEAEDKNEGSYTTTTTGQLGALSATTSATYMEPYESYDSPFSRSPSRQSYRSGYVDAFSAASQPNTTYLGSPPYLCTVGQYEQQSYYIPTTSQPSAPNTYPHPHGGNAEDACSYQIHRLRMKLEDMLSSLPPNTGEAQPTSNQLGLDQILATTEELIAVMNQLRVETSGPHGLDLHEEALLGFNTTPSVYVFPDIDTNSFLAITTCYIYVLKLYEPIIMSLYLKAEQQQHQQPHAGMMQYPSGIPNVNLGSLTLTASDDLNIGLVVNLIYQTVERLQAVLHPLLPASNHSPTSHRGDGSGGHSLQGSPQTSYGGDDFPPLGGDITTITVESALHQLHSKEQSTMSFLNMIKAMLSASNPQLLH